MTPAELQAARERANKCTQPAPWTVREDIDHRGSHTERRCVVVDANGLWVADCGDDDEQSAFIAASRALLPALLDECERLTKEREEERAHHAELSSRYHNAARSTCESLAAQVKALTKDNALLADQLNKAVDRFVAADNENTALVASLAIARKALETIEGGFGGGKIGASDPPRASDVAEHAGFYRGVAIAALAEMEKANG